MTHDKEKENFGEKRNQDESNFIEWEEKNSARPNCCSKHS